jgi:hypothetical protein
MASSVVAAALALILVKRHVFPIESKPAQRGRQYSEAIAKSQPARSFSAGVPSRTPGVALELGDHPIARAKSPRRICCASGFSICD